MSDNYNSDLWQKAPFFDGYGMVFIAQPGADQEALKQDAFRVINEYRKAFPDNEQRYGHYDETVNRIPYRRDIPIEIDMLSAEIVLAQEATGGAKSVIFGWTDKDFRRLHEYNNFTPAQYEWLLQDHAVGNDPEKRTALGQHLADEAGQGVYFKLNSNSNAFFFSGKGNRENDQVLSEIAARYANLAGEPCAVRFSNGMTEVVYPGDGETTGNRLNDKRTYENTREAIAELREATAQPATLKNFQPAVLRHYLSADPDAPGNVKWNQFTETLRDELHAQHLTIEPDRFDGFARELLQNMQETVARGRAERSDSSPPPSADVLRAGEQVDAALRKQLAALDLPDPVEDTVARMIDGGGFEQHDNCG